METSGGVQYLRLFPLQAVVLFPGMELPLVVFEPRYLQLTDECLESDEPFGVALLREGAEVGQNRSDPFEVGTTAHILSATDAGGGRLSVVAVGGRRFRVRSFLRDSPYLAAEVEYLEDDSHEMADPSLVENVRWDAATFVRRLVASRGGYVRQVNFPNDPVVLSYQVAQIFQGNPYAQQKLLEQPTFDRLWEELDMLRIARNQLDEQGSSGRKREFSDN